MITRGLSGLVGMFMSDTVPRPWLFLVLAYRSKNVASSFASVSKAGILVADTRQFDFEIGEFIVSCF